jgi:predicted acyl esterase
VLATTAKASAATLETEMVPMADGTKLATDVIKPDGEGPWPVLLYRTPYNKKNYRSGKGQLPDNTGVASVIQDLRGRYASEGTDCVFRCDKKDGSRTIRWIDNQPWSNGKIASDGASAGGIAQYMHAAAGPEALDAMFVRIATPKLYDHGIFWDGVFRQSLLNRWLEDRGSSFFLDKVEQHPTEDAFWDPVQTRDDWGNVDVPVVHWGGWYDIFSQGTIDAFRGYQHHGAAGAKNRQKLVMGPWVHGAANRRQQGDLQYPRNATEGGPIEEKMYTRWLAHQLGIQDHSQWLENLPTVYYYVMGAVGEPSAPGNKWRTNDQWPPESEPVRMYLQPGGGLSATCPPEQAGTTQYTYDPNAPAPTRGGNNLKIESGPVDQRSVEQRDDVVVFETPELSEPMEITGRVKAHLSVSIDAPDTDLMVRMTDVYPDGRSMLVLDAPARIASRNGDESFDFATPGEVVEVTVDLWSTSIILAEGHKLRISVTSSNAPRFRPNPNDGSTYGEPAEPQPATVRVHHSREHPSYLVVPDPGAAESAVVRCEASSADPAPGDAGTAGDTGMEDVANHGTSEDDTGGPDDELDGGGVNRGDVSNATESSRCSCRAVGGGPMPLELTLLLVGLVAIRPTGDR